MVPDHHVFFIDPNRCIGCEACVHGCAECDTHKGMPMIHLEFIDRARTVQTAPVVCMHCSAPTCAEVCPADAIKRTGDGVVQTARKPRCIACDNCVLACPFGVPKSNPGLELMMKCDLCYDRTSVGLKPMCASVCPSGALFFGTFEEIERDRPRSEPINRFQFGRQEVVTRVHMMVPSDRPVEIIDVLSAMSGEPPAPARPAAPPMMGDGFVPADDLLLASIHDAGETP